MLWACLRFPRLALDALHSSADVSNPGKPHAVVEGPTQRRQIVLADASAQRFGVRAGHSLATAQALCPQLTAWVRDEAAERQSLESIAAWAYRFSADIHQDATDAIFIEIGASLNLFGGWPALERRLRHELARFGFAYTLAAAPTATAAHVLATHSEGTAIPGSATLATALGPLPISAGGLGAKTVAALHGMGFRRLRDLFPLPRPELTRRIGAEALDRLDRMRGLMPETLPRWLPPPRFERRIEFSYGVESTTALAFPLQRLVRELALFLVARDGGVQRFALALGHERNASTRLEIGLLAPQRDAASLFELARTRLDRLELAGPVHALALCADDLPPLCPLHRDLFDDRRSEQLDWPALVERLRARLGDEALHGLTEVADHRPGRAWRFETALRGPAVPGRRPAPASTRRAGSTESPMSAPAPTSLPPGARPFWLLRRPIPLRTGPLRILAGPERIESGWWDDHDYRRDYYVVETRPGQRAWAFVEAGTTAHWSLHGWFA